MERFVGKTAVLGLGFGMGAARFESTVWSQSQRQHRIDTQLAQRAVTTYRYTYPEVPRYWKVMDEVIHALSVRASREVGPLIVDGITQSVILPNGMRLFYSNMRQDHHHERSYADSS